MISALTLDRLSAMAAMASMLKSSVGSYDAAFNTWKIFPHEKKQMVATTEKQKGKYLNCMINNLFSCERWKLDIVCKNTVAEDGREFYRKLDLR